MRVSLSCNIYQSVKKDVKFVYRERGTSPPPPRGLEPMTLTEPVGCSSAELQVTPAELGHIPGRLIFQSVCVKHLLAKIGGKVQFVVLSTETVVDFRSLIR